MSEKTGGWIAVDLDGTLAKYDGWVSETHIGPPIPRMVARVKQWLAEGKDVRIFTARASGRTGDTHAQTIQAIKAWCFQHLGAKLPVICCKDFAMIELWDDRCVQVESNTGRRVDGVGS